jgi:hypothetical protein
MNQRFFHGHQKYTLVLEFHLSSAHVGVGLNLENSFAKCMLNME